MHLGLGGPQGKLIVVFFHLCGVWHGVVCGVWCVVTGSNRGAQTLLTSTQMAQTNQLETPPLVHQLEKSCPN